MAQCTGQFASGLRQTPPRPRVAQVVAYRGLSDQSLPLSYGALVRLFAVAVHNPAIRTNAKEGPLLSTTDQVPLCHLSLWTALQLALDRIRADLRTNALLSATWSGNRMARNGAVHYCRVQLRPFNRRGPQFQY